VLGVLFLAKPRRICGLQYLRVTVVSWIHNYNETHISIEAVTCTICTRIHLINPKTGKGEDAYFWFHAAVMNNPPNLHSQKNSKSFLIFPAINSDGRASNAKVHAFCRNGSRDRD